MKKLIIGTLTLAAFLFISTASIAQEKAEDKQAPKQTTQTTKPKVAIENASSAKKQCAKKRGKASCCSKMEASTKKESKATARKED